MSDNLRILTSNHSNVIMELLRILNRKIKITANIHCIFRATERTLPTIRQKSTKIEDSIDFPEDQEYEEFLKDYLPYGVEHSCFIIHPYIKWGPQKQVDTNPTNQLNEAVSLIRTLSTWKVYKELAIPVETLERKTIFGSGNLEKLRTTIQSDPNVTSVFLNVSTLKSSQREELQTQFQVPIFDRFHIVMLILKQHAMSKHAKLQVALAELNYLQSKMKRHNLSPALESKKRMLQLREQKIKDAVKKLRKHRELLRTNRRQREYPVVAVVGYTNAGKTSIIKALTMDASLKPRNQLFATLDVTMHEGLLPSRLKVLYVDTVGFISSIPTMLIECFVATLEDALLADVILHVEDLSNENLLHQRNHVNETLKNLAKTVKNEAILDKIITVGNKCDVAASSSSAEGLKVSAKTGSGIKELKDKLEEVILEATNRKIVVFRIPNGGDEIQWLYKNATVHSVEADPKDSQFQHVSVIISQSKLQQFKHHFYRK